MKGIKKKMTKPKNGIMEVKFVAIANPITTTKTFQKPN
jgi:hypothetical protein